MRAEPGGPPRNVTGRGARLDRGERGGAFRPHPTEPVARAEQGWVGGQDHQNDRQEQGHRPDARQQAALHV